MSDLSNLEYGELTPVEAIDFVSETVKSVRDEMLEKKFVQAQIFGNELLSFVVPTVVGIDAVKSPDDWQAAHNVIAREPHINWLGITSSVRRAIVTKTALNGYYASEPLSVPTPQRTHAADRWHEFLTLPSDDDYRTRMMRIRSWTIPLRDYYLLRNLAELHQGGNQVYRQLDDWEYRHRKKDRHNGAPLTAIHVEDYIIDPEGPANEAAFAAAAHHVRILLEAKEAIIRHRLLIEKQR